MTSPQHGSERSFPAPSLSAEIRSSALLLGLIAAVLLVGTGIGVLTSLAG